MIAHNSTRFHAPQADRVEEVLDVVLPADHQPTKVMDPSEKSLPVAPGCGATRTYFRIAGIPVRLDVNRSTRPTSAVARAEDDHLTSDSDRLDRDLAEATAS